tara:strand:- start:412 stop:996 length:585 start_codon:yes stop_codon:yes gene_type:complete
MTKHTPAKYKIELHFNKGRTTSGPNVAAITIFQSGCRLNGEGDELVYICAERDRGLALNAPGVKDRAIIKGYAGCGKIIEGDNIKGGVALCRGCVGGKDNMIASENLTSTLLVNLTTEKLSVMVADIFRRLNSDADIYIKYHPTDLRVEAMNNVHNLDKGRMSRGLTIYPLANIVKDTIDGTSVETRFKALFSA